MLEEIIQSCCTGFGDCVVGYISAYILKKQLEKLYLKKEIKLTIGWHYVKCPYIAPQHISDNYYKRQKSAFVNCLYYGDDGTLAFAQYYKSPKMFYDLNHKKYLKITINQYIGKCIIDETTTREDIKNLTYEAYKYFWNNVIDHNLIPQNIRNPGYNYDKMMTIYVRIGDQYLCGGNKNTQPPLEQCYQYLKVIQHLPYISLIGDTNNQAMSDVYQKMYGTNNTMILTSGPISHSCGRISIEQWNKIFGDLYQILQSKSVVILSNWSNFTRIVLFLREIPDQMIYFLKNDTLELVEDTSTLFSKHYQF